MNDSLTELVDSPGWTILIKKLGKRKKSAYNVLRSSQELNRIIRAQVQLEEIEFLEQYPHKIIKGEKDEKDGI